MRQRQAKLSTVEVLTSITNLSKHGMIDLLLTSVKIKKISKLFARRLAEPRTNFSERYYSRDRELWKTGFLGCDVEEFIGYFPQKSWPKIIYTINGY